MQINIFKIMKYLPYVFIAVLLFFMINRTINLEKKNVELSKKANEHEIKAEIYLQMYDSILRKDSVLKLKYDSLYLIRSQIKVKYNEKIKVIDRYSVSDMQQYFDKRTGKSSSPR